MIDQVEAIAREILGSELIDLLAEVDYKYFRALRNKGFTQEQAIEIVSHRKLTGG